jgi:hypothetical protein
VAPLSRKIIFSMRTLPYQGLMKTEFHPNESPAENQTLYRGGNLTGAVRRDRPAMPLVGFPRFRLTHYGHMLIMIS